MDMDVAEYSEYVFKCNLRDVRQWVTQSIYQFLLGTYQTHVRVAMIFLDVLCSKSLFSLLVCLTRNLTDIVL